MTTLAPASVIDASDEFGLDYLEEEGEFIIIDRVENVGRETTKSWERAVNLCARINRHPEQFRAFWELQKWSFRRWDERTQEGEAQAFQDFLDLEAMIGEYR